MKERDNLAVENDSLKREKSELEQVIEGVKKEVEALNSEKLADTQQLEDLKRKNIEAQ